MCWPPTLFLQPFCPSLQHCGHPVTQRRHYLNFGFIWGIGSFLPVFTAAVFVLSTVGHRQRTVHWRTKGSFQQDLRFVVLLAGGGSCKRGPTEEGFTGVLTLMKCLQWCPGGAVKHTGQSVDWNYTPPCVLVSRYFLKRVVMNRSTFDVRNFESAWRKRVSWRLSVDGFCAQKGIVGQ